MELWGERVRGKVKGEKEKRKRDASKRLANHNFLVVSGFFWESHSGWCVSLTLWLLVRRFFTFLTRPMDALAFRNNSKSCRGSVNHFLAESGVQK